MDISRKTINVSKMLFYISYFLLIAQSMTRWVNNIELFSSFCTIIIPILLLFSILAQVNKYTKNNVLLFIFLIIISFLSFYVSGDIAILYIVLFIMASKNLEFKKIVKFDLVIKLSLLCLVLFLYFRGMTEVVISYNVRGVRYALGFGHPNTLSVYVLGICSDIAFLTYEKRNLKWYMLLAIIAILINAICRSRGSVIGIILLVALSILIPKLKNNFAFQKIVIYLFPILFFLSILSSYLFLNYDIDLLNSLDELFSNRISLMAVFLENYSINLFGNKFINYATGVTGTSYVLDNAYLSMLLKFGLCVTTMFLFMIPMKMKDAIKNNQDAIIICLISFIVFGLMENGFYVLFYNPFLLSLGDLIYKKEKI